MRVLFTIMGLALFLVGLTSCEDILEVPDISGQRVELVAPLNNTVVNQNTVNLTWNGLADVDAYRIQVALPNFENAAQIVLDSLIVRDTLGQIATGLERLLLLNGGYEWRIQGLNSGFETPFTSAIFSINGDENLDLTPPNVPIPTSPSDGASLDDAEVNFAWTRQDVSGTAERDSIFIFKDEALQVLETKGLGANKTYTTNLGDDTYFWFVQAFDGAGNESNTSEVFEFTVNVP
ncbi:hypothetical protein [Ulvibacterium sp.]|uniref:hypothetical protein n=1 Tax=Ulvibacterium sp. TaxID=2665914 RepID=UPI002604E3D0|nr:hypothetical protein [Ulvibacterium sp.]